MEILRRILNRIRPRERKTLGETVSEERHSVEEESRNILRVVTSEESSSEAVLGNLYALMKKLQSNPMVARNSVETAGIILGLFVSTKSRNVKVLCARILLALHTSKNSLVISQLPIILKTETDPRILTMFTNVVF